MQRRSLSFRTMIEQAKLYFIPKKREFLKIQPGTGDNLLREDRALGYTDYMLWSTFKPQDLGIDGELDMECLDSGMVMMKGDSPGQARNDTEELSEINILGSVLEQAYGDRDVATILLITE